MNARQEHRGGTRLIMVFEKVSAGRNIIRSPVEQVTLDSRSIASNQSIIQLLVVPEIKAQGLQTPLGAPIGLGKKEEVGMGLFYGRYGGGPEIGGWGGCLLRVL